MGHWTCECCSKPKKEQAHVAQDDEEALLLLASASRAEVEIHEGKVFTHLDEEKERDAGTWVLDIGVTNHISGCQVAFTKIDTTVLGTVHFGDDSVAQSRTAGLSCSCARTMSPGSLMESTSSLV
jgi:hypothetical protein